MATLDIGSGAFYGGTDDGTTNGDGSLILLGELDLDFVNGSSSEYNTRNGPVGFARAKPGLDLIQGGAQVYKIIEFTGSGSGRVKFNVDVEFDVEAIAAGGDVMLTTQIFVYDFYNETFLEKDKIRPASDPGTPLASLWSNSGTASEDIFADISAGDAVAVGTRVLVGAASGGISTAYADARSGPSYEGNEFIEQQDILVSWE